MLKRTLRAIGIPALAFAGMLAIVHPPQANAAVRFGVTVGGPVYAYPAYPYPYRYYPYDYYYHYPHHHYRARVYVYPHGYWHRGRHGYEWRYRR